MDFMKLNIQLFADGKVVIDTELNTKDFEQGLNKIQTSSQKAGTSIKNIVAGLGITKLISKGLSVINNSIADTVKRVDTLNNFPKVMKNLGIATDDAQKSIDKMSDKLAGLPTTLDQGAMAVQRFTSKNGDIAKSTDIFLALNNAILAGGANTQIQSNALEQLSQSYAKGRMDMMEWRAIQTAMPAQLKQVATAMGLTTDELGEMMREGKNTSQIMDEFMDTIIKLNKEGVNGFQSFEKQARNSTGGIGTAITVAKTQVVKGMADIVSGINKGLKKAKLGSISDIIANIGKKVKEALSKVGTALSKIDFKGLLNILSKLVPIITSVVAGFVAYHVALKAISAYNIVKDITLAISAMIKLTNATELSAGAMKIFNTLMNTNPIGLVVTAVVTLTTALIAFSSESDNTNKKLEELKKKSKEYDNAMKEINKRKDESLSASMNEIYGYQSLYNELQEIVDENGKVKAGYEERAKIITGELSKALGIEIDLVDGVIQNYQELQQEISNLIEKKKAEAYFNAHEEEYNKALKEESGLYKDVADAASKRQKALDKMTTALDKEIEKDKELGKYREDILKFLKSEVTWSDLSFEARKAYNNMSDETIEILNKEEDAYYKHNEELKTASKLYAKNEEIIKKNREASEALTKADQALKEGKKETADEYLRQVARIYNDTVTFNGKIQKENDEAYEKEKTNRQAYLDFLKEHQDKYSEDFIKSEEDRIAKELKQLEKEKNDANEVIKKKNQETLDTTRAGINDQLKALTDKQYEFRDAGNGNVQLYIDGVASGKPMATTKASEITSATIEQLNSGKINAKTAGKYLTQGFVEGMDGGIANVISKASQIALSAVNEINAKLGIASPSKVTREIGKYFSQGFALGVEDEERNSLKVVKDYGTEMLDGLDDVYLQMQKSVALETSKMSANVKTSGTYQIAMNSTPTFNLRDNSTNRTELVVDGRKLAEVVNTQNRSREVAKA